MLGSPLLFPVPGPAACLLVLGGRLAPRGSVMMEAPRAAGGRLAESWARKAYAVGCSARRRDHGPRTEAGRKPCGLWGLYSGSVAGLRALGFAPDLPRSRPCGVLARWWASGASRFRDDGNPHGPRAGAVPRAGPAKLTLWDVLGGDETTGP